MIFHDILKRPAKQVVYKILFTSDIHGSEEVFDKLLQYALQLEVNAVMVAGDFTGKTLLFLEKKADGSLLTDFYEDLTTISSNDIPAFLSEVQSNGCYYVFVTPDERMTLVNEREKRQFVRTQLQSNRLMAWLRKAEAVLKPSNIRFISICGNDDVYELDNLFLASPYYENPDIQPILLFSDIYVIGESRVNITPWKRPRDFEDEIPVQYLRDKIQPYAENKMIFLFHAPPFNSSLDLVPNQKVTAGGQELIPVGSKTVRKVIEEFQPMLSLHGHIHESEGDTYIGRTLCINPGSDEYKGRHTGTLRAALINFLSDGSIDNYSIIK